MKFHINSMGEEPENNKLRLKLIEARMVTQAIRELHFCAIDDAQLPNFSAGAHVDFNTKAGERSYSLIAQNPERDCLSPGRYVVAVQLEPDSSGGSSFMHDLHIGDQVEAFGPKNDFPLLADKPALLLAGGIGVTPLISMAAKLNANATEFQFHYAVRSNDLMAYMKELQTAFGSSFYPHFDDDPKTALSLDGLIETLTNDQHLYICGPKGMIEAAKSKAEVAGVSQDRIHFELFASPAAESDDTAFEVEISSTGQVFTVPADKTIIEALEAEDVDLMYDCQRGDCGICQTDVIDGVPDHRDVVLSAAEKESGKVMQICVSRAKSERLVLDL